ncbi:MAG: tRNA epoxyqueuosine(34) reductase QueG [Chloroflexi bacterium]|nr:tRNA epoxyqueuosine(34) reductase QueG [Chloroflexota bacterium]|tara:strand:+ start:21 stop:1148 length:1128 start_codon:yes stop_codon:yes gene_type:complete
MKTREQIVIEIAKSVGFDLVGISEANILKDHIKNSLAAYELNYLDGMPWLNKERLIKAGSPNQLLLNPKSVIVVGVNYKQNENQTSPINSTKGRIAMYAQWEDYHLVIKKMLKEYKAILQDKLSINMDGRIFVDDGSLLEKGFAEKAGLGWFGKHTNIINPIYGSWIFLGALITDLELTPNEPVKKNCGKCELCIIECPTKAIVSPYQLDANKCISFLTIENKGAIPYELRSLIDDWIFGCDICQDICPVNDKSDVSQNITFTKKTNNYLDLVEILYMSKEQFSSRFSKSPIKRTKLSGLQRNACVAIGNIKILEAIPALIDTLNNNESELVRGHSAWALGEINTKACQKALKISLEYENDQFVIDEINRALMSK